MSGLNRKNPKRDSNEKEIVVALRAVGAKVRRVSGEGIPDTLVLFRNRLFLLEIKRAKGVLTEAQVGFFKDAEGVEGIGVVRDIDEALAFIGAV